MAKIILWIIVVFAILFVLRMINAAKAKAKRDSASGSQPDAHAMVRCATCGVYVPRADAKPGPRGLTCGDPVCLSR
ncbi:MAG: hypothetical protein M3Z31_16150 [Pseudomonadota bacterium]|nr:hypothetical protein [Pseudomonadota bacterium]